MKAARARRFAQKGISPEIAELNLRLAEANETLRAIRSGEVDAVVVAGKQGPQVFTLAGAEHLYRVLIESMNEGALMLSPDKTVLYANLYFARMVKCPLEKVIGGSFRRFISFEDQLKLRTLLTRLHKSGEKIQATLVASNGSKIPVQISLRPLASNGFNRATIGMVVTDLTQARQAEELLRALTKRVVQVQEAERGRVAFELHDNITQLICALLFRSQALADMLSSKDGKSKKEADKLLEMLGKTAQEVDRISHNLGPNVLDHLGLATAMSDVGTEFSGRTGVAVRLALSPFARRLSAETELALYRILQEALRNIEKHADARNVDVRLGRRGAFVRFTINDDGIGFQPSQGSNGLMGTGGLGLLSMRERASYVGGALSIRSVQRKGTEIEVLIPHAKRPRAAA